MNQTAKGNHNNHTDILHKIFDKSTEGFQVIDKDWKYIYVNETVAKQGRSTVEDLTGHTMMEKYPGIENTPVFEQIKRCVSEKVGIRMENEFVFPNGEKGWFQLFIHEWEGGVIIFSVDITYRKQSELFLRKMMENLKGTLAAPDDQKKMDELMKALDNISKPSVTVIE